MEIEGVRERESGREGEMGGRGRGLGREARRHSFFTNSRHCTNPPSTHRHSSSLCSGQPFLVHQTRQNARIQALTQRVLRAAFPCWRGIVASTNPPSTTTQATSLPLHPSLSLSLPPSPSPHSASTNRWTPSALEGLNGVLGANLKAFEILH